MTSNPEVSIVVPCFNVGARGAATRDSVRQQSFQDYELIFVDDGSTDDSLNDLREARSPAERFLSLPRNSGASAARNFGFDVSRGRYLMFLDADDLLAPNALQDHVEVLTSGADVSHADWQMIWNDRPTDQVANANAAQPTLCEILSRAWWVPTGGVLLKRSIATAVDEHFDGWNTRLPLMEDVHYLACLKALGAHFEGTGKLGVSYRYSPRSTAHAADRLAHIYSNLNLLNLWINQVGQLPKLSKLRVEYLKRLRDYADLSVRVEPEQHPAPGE